MGELRPGIVQGVVVIVERNEAAVDDEQQVAQRRIREGAALRGRSALGLVRASRKTWSTLRQVKSRSRLRSLGSVRCKLT